MTSSRRALPVFLRPGDPVGFPDPRRYDPDGLVAVGGDLAPERLLGAYGSGVFPWYGAGDLPLWWSPDPRGCFVDGRLHVSRSMGKVLRRSGFRLTWNHAFGAVMEGCAERRDDGTWIHQEMLEAYARLHALGDAHSLEVWAGDDLVAGIYGVQVGGMFAAESKFHRQRDMSKVALVALVRSLARAGVALIDVQFATAHLRSLGAVTLGRREYLDRLDVVRTARVDLSELRPSV